jgi:FkbM family methyltransferase
MSHFSIRSLLSSWLLRFASASGLSLRLQRAPVLYRPLRALLVGLVGKGGSREIVVGPLAGYRLCLGPADRNAYLVNEHEPEIVDVIHEHCLPDMHVLDLGAHIGYFTLLLAVRVGPRGHVYAFEPNPSNFAKINSMIVTNGLTNVNVFPCAVADVNCEMSFTVEPTGQMGHISPDQSAASPETVTVDAVRIDDMFGESGLKRLDFVKMDVEGAEPKALAGMGELLRRFGPTVVCEWHPSVAGIDYVSAFNQVGYECTLLEPESPSKPFHVLARPRRTK